MQPVCVGEGPERQDMSPPFRWFISGMLIATGVVLMAIALSGCATLENAGLYAKTDEWCAKHPEAPKRNCARADSWDQENLKRHDKGCPTAIYVAPEGNLTLCYPSE